MTHAVTVNAAVVLQYQQTICFQVPQWIVSRCCPATYTALRAGLHCRLKQLQERNNTRMGRFTVANRTTQRTDGTEVNANAGTLGDVLHNGRGRCVDGLQ